jgi:hypothetical protein
MAILWMLEWEGITPEQYESLRREVNWEGDVPDGLEYHVAAFSEKSLIVIEVWESPDHVQPFIDGRLLPAVGALGIRSMPKVDLYPAQAIFAP